MSVIGPYLVAAIIFGILDYLWLGPIGRPIYNARMGSILAPQFNMVAAMIFYVIYIGGITYFATYPALAEGSLGKAALAGAIFGFMAYATYNFTALAVIKDYPASIVPIDLAWGTIATMVASVGTYLICRAVPFLS